MALRSFRDVRLNDEFQEARQERIDDFRRFNENEAEMERQSWANKVAEEARKARLAKFAGEVEKLEGKL